VDYVCVCVCAQVSTGLFRFAPSLLAALSVTNVPFVAVNGGSLIYFKLARLILCWLVPSVVILTNVSAPLAWHVSFHVSLFLCQFGYQCHCNIKSH
jgi:hypothetical protein